MGSKRFLFPAARFDQPRPSVWLVPEILNRLRAVLALCACVFTIVGCLHSPAPYRPKDWASKPIDIQSISENADQPRLQVIIVYGPLWCHHSALRLQGAGGRVLFWDPGGSYGVSDSIQRSKDLIEVDPPDLGRYLEFARQHSSKEVEVFEWDLSDQEANRLYDILSHGNPRDGASGKFSTSTMGGFCAVALSDFLNRFGPAGISVPGKFFLPHNLARVLYARSPKRILVFQRGAVRVVAPP
jgi:hypothetical protein